MLPEAARKATRRLVLRDPHPHPSLRGRSMTDRQRGVVLVTVIWLIALLSALAMAASITFRGFASFVALDRDRVQAEALLTGGIEAAVRTIENLGDAPLNEFETTITLVTGSVRTDLSDEGGRIDIGKAPV